MQNSSEMYSQKDLLKERYIENSSYFDKLAWFFGKQGLIAKICIYSSLIAGLVLSSVFFNPISIGLFGMALFFLGSVHMQNNSLLHRFDVMFDDLGVSEKQLQQALSLNQDLENQLKQAYQSNFAIHSQLEQSKIQISVMSESAHQKKSEIDAAHQKISEHAQRAEYLCNRVHALEQELKITIHSVLDKFKTGPDDNPLDANRPGFFNKN